MIRNRFHLMIFMLVCGLAILPGCKNAVSGGFFGLGNSNTDDSSDDDDPNTNGDSGSSIVSSLRMGDRNFVADSLESIFGTSSDVTNVTNLLIRRQIDNFGGPRDIFRDPSEAECAGGYCYAPSSSQAPVIAAATSVREAFRIRACYEILKVKTNMLEIPLLTAIGMAKGTITEPVLLSIENNFFSTLAAPTDEEITAAFELFNPGEEPGATLVAALRNFTQEISLSTQFSDPTKEAWRFLFLSLCTAPEWQIP